MNAAGAEWSSWTQSSSELSETALNELNNRNNGFAEDGNGIGEFVGATDRHLSVSDVRAQVQA
jgi:hypothetical protein